MSLSMRASVSGPTTDFYTVTNRDGLVLIDGSVPSSQFVALSGTLPKKSVMSAHLSHLLGVTFAMGLPEDIDRAVAAAEADWVRRNPSATAPVRWSVIGRRGASSNAIAYHTVGLSCGDPLAYPVDSDDLSRCFALLHEVPEAAAVFASIMPKVSPKWAALVSVWPALESFYLAGYGAPWLDGWKPRKPGPKARLTDDLLRETLNSA